jgi:hypothetical protein
MKRKAVLIGLAAAVAITAATRAPRGGHELPVYPSYYPHEIEISAVAPADASGLLLDGKMHAYVGSAPRFAGTPGDAIRSIESLGAFITIRVNPSSPRAQEDASACAVVRAVARAVAGAGNVIIHPYPVTPFHGDYLYHADVVAEVAARLLGEKAAPAIQDLKVQDLKVRAFGTVASRIAASHTAASDWDVEVEETGASELVLASTTAINGWLGPPELRAGWYQAYLILADALDANTRESVDGTLQRLRSGELAEPAERINLERALVAELIGGCRKVVIGYTVKREYFNAEFSAGIENIAHDALAGLHAPMFLRTVKLKDFPWNGWLALGIDAQPTAAWNPIAGFTDGFGRLMWFGLADPAELSSPYDSTWMLNRISDVQAMPRR